MSGCYLSSRWWSIYHAYYYRFSTKLDQIELGHITYKWYHANDSYVIQLEFELKIIWKLTWHVSCQNKRTSQLKVNRLLRNRSGGVPKSTVLINRSRGRVRGFLIGRADRGGECHVWPITEDPPLNKQTDRQARLKTLQFPQSTYVGSNQG